MTLAATPAAAPKSTTSLRSWAARTYDWRISAYALAALPVGVVAAPLALLGFSRPAYRLQRALAVRLLGARIAEPARGRAARVVGHSLLALPLQLLTGILAGALWADILTRGVCYPLVEVGHDVSQAWGGPTMAGAWAAHFGVGVLTLAILLPVVRLLTGAQRRIAVRLLGTGSAC